MENGPVWEMFVRGGVAGLLVFHLAHLAWPAAHHRIRLALGAFTLSMLAYLFCSMPRAAFHSFGWLGLPLLALCVSTVPLLWVAVRAVFDDGFRFTPAVLGLPAAAMLLGLAAHAPIDPQLVSPPVRQAFAIASRLATAGFLLAALWETARGWRDDLVEPRRMARRWVALGIGLYAGVVFAVEIALGDQPPGRFLPVLNVLGIGTVALALALVVARQSMNELFDPAQAALPEPEPPAAEPHETAVPEGTDRALLARLTHAMTAGHAYRQEGLTLGALAGMLGAGEAALRGLINQGLGYRNFNDFLHRYRLEEAAARLVAEELPILSIALECGYGSIGPFNRAFRQRFGMTPTQHRAGGRLAPDRRPAAPALALPGAERPARATK
jgi:AraC-like DNA-binding protein